MAKRKPPYGVSGLFVFQITARCSDVVISDGKRVDAQQSRIYLDEGERHLHAQTLTQSADVVHRLGGSQALAVLAEGFSIVWEDERWKHTRRRWFGSLRLV